MVHCIEQTEVITETRLGTRPRSCFAKVLDEVLSIVGDEGTLTELNWSGRRALIPQASGGDGFFYGLTG